MDLQDDYQYYIVDIETGKKTDDGRMTKRQTRAKLRAMPKKEREGWLVSAVRVTMITPEPPSFNDIGIASPMAEPQEVETIAASLRAAFFLEISA